MPRSASAIKPPGRFRAQLQGGGLDTLLDTDDFGCWAAAVSTTLGHHRSKPLDVREPFKARFRSGRLRLSR